MHLGHAALLDAAGALARRRGVPVVAVTFDPHPATVLRPGAGPRRLTSLEQKYRRLRAAGADRVVVLEPTLERLGQSPEQFVQWLWDAHRPMAIVEGPDFHFGKARRGNIGQLRQAGRSMGFEVIQVATHKIVLNDLYAVPVRSSLIRWLLAHGRVADAARCLDQPYNVTGRIVEGEQRGRRIGVPTANLASADLEGFMVPAHGVYAGLAELPNGDQRPAAVSIGTKPTFGSHDPVIEAHLLDFDADLRDQTVTVHFVRWLRDQHRFPGLDALCRQLQRDIAQIRRWDALGLLARDSHRNGTTAAAG